jgi:predicted dehydrogenase
MIEVTFMRIYLIGAGAISRHHAEAINKLPGGGEIEVKVADPSSVALSGFKERFPDAEAFSYAGVMLSQPANEDDIVIIATPPVTHFSLSRLALESGRHVLCEKPFVMNRQEADEILKIAQENNRIIGCCSDRFLGLSKTTEVKKLLASGVLGEIYKVTFVHKGERSRPGIEYQPESKWFLDRSKSGGGILMDWGPYDFSILNDVLKPSSIEVLGGWTSQPQTEVDPEDTVNDVETHVGALMKYESEDGKQIWVNYERASCTHGEPHNHVEIEGSLGAVKWEPLFGSDEISCRSDQRGQATVEKFTPENKDQYGFMENPIYYFSELVKGNPSPALINESAVFNFQCFRAIYDFVETGERQTVERNKSNTLAL